MSKSHYLLYNILSACAGNWRNCIYVSASGSGYLLSTDRDSRPIVMSVEQFRQLTGEHIDPSECCGQLTEEGFSTLFAQYLLWFLPSSSENPLAQLCQP